ncbi:MAG: glycosyltransferase family 39 protein [Kiritimatiellae bacterium]|nr:glycosyltransferase family 39 protein [Kiritimatiellia bacterium]
MIGATARQLLVLLGILGAGLLLRLAYLSELRRAPDFPAPQVDADFHNYWARGIAFGDWNRPGGGPAPGIPTAPYFRPPGYPYFLALVYRLFGPGYLAPRLVQFGLGLLNVLLAFLLARRWYGPGIALIWAALMATYWIFIYFEGEFHAPVLTVCLLLSLTAVLAGWTTGPSWPRGLAAGLLAGLSALVRPNLLLLFPLGAAWGLWVMRGRHARRAVLAALLAFGAGGLAAIAPATIRNLRAAGEWVLISSNGGINLYIGNNASADGFCATAIDGLGPFKTCYDYPAIIAALEQQQGRRLTYGEVSGHFTRQALHFIRTQPGRAFGLTLRKALLFWSPWEHTHNKVVHCERHASRVLRAIPGNFALVLALAAAGAVAWVRERRRDAPRETADSAARRRHGQVTALIALLIGLYVLSVVPFFVAARYRVAILPFLLLFAAFALHHLYRTVRARAVRRALLWLAGIGAAFAVFSFDPFGYTPDVARWHYARGVAYNIRQEPARAVAEFEHAVRANPGFIQAHVDLGVALGMSGRIAASMPHFSAALRLDPNDVLAHLNLAIALEKAGRPAESAAHYAEVLRLRPGHPAAAEGLARTRRSEKH